MCLMSMILYRIQIYSIIQNHIDDPYVNHLPCNNIHYLSSEGSTEHHLRCLYRNNIQCLGSYILFSRFIQKKFRQTYLTTQNVCLI